MLPVCASGAVYIGMGRVELGHGRGTKSTAGMSKRQQKLIKSLYLAKNAKGC